MKFLVLIFSLFVFQSAFTIRILSGGDGVGFEFDIPDDMHDTFFLVVKSSRHLNSSIRAV